MPVRDAHPGGVTRGRPDHASEERHLGWFDQQPRTPRAVASRNNRTVCSAARCHWRHQVVRGDDVEGTSYQSGSDQVAVEHFDQP